MAALKWIFVALFSVGAAGAVGFGLMERGNGRTVTQRTPPPISLRAFPAMAVAAAAAPEAAQANPAEAAAKPEEPVAAKPPEPKPAEPVAAKPPEPKPAEPVAAKPPEPKAAEPKPAEPVAAKPPEPKPAEPAAAKPPPAPAAEGMLNLRASDTADVYLDGKKLGGSPILGVKARAGSHKVRFDCYDSAGNTITGAVQSVTVKPDGETDVEFPCPAE